MSAIDILKATKQGAEQVRYGSRLACTRSGAHWRSQANTTEQPVFGGDAALRQITFTTYSI